MFGLIDPIIVDSYLHKQAVFTRMIRYPVPDELGLVVAIPAFSEPDIHSTLHSLSKCQYPGCEVEVLVLVNYGETADDKTKEENQQMYVTLKKNRTQYENVWLKVYPLLANDLPKRTAGVGLARKIAMDEAARRFGRMQRDGVILCLDADCTVSENYLREVRRQFSRHDEMYASSIYFEHPIPTSGDRHARNAILLYELHLRYFKNALAWTGHPQAAYTVGSSMAVLASAYVAQGGMNKRKAGEDFYFLQKFLEIGRCFPINTTCVYPSGRLSHRVPFGTGKAVAEYLKGHTQKTYSWHSFQLLKQFFGAIPQLYESIDPTDQLPEELMPFLHKNNFASRWSELHRHTASFSSFKGRFYRWFNAFRVMKLLHYLRDHHYPDQEVTGEASKLSPLFGLIDEKNPERLLEAYRQFDRSPVSFDQEFSS